MDTKEFKNTLSSLDHRKISDLSYQILNIEDLETLRDLAKYFVKAEDEIRSEHGSNDSVNRISSFLHPIFSGACRCTKYNICTYFPYSEAKKGLVEILSNESNKATYESRIMCECVLCHTQFNVHEYEAGFGRRPEWAKKI